MYCGNTPKYLIYPCGAVFIKGGVNESILKSARYIRLPDLL